MTNSKKTRKAHDFLGEIHIPKNAYYGSQTARAKENFQISGIKSPQIFNESLGLVKLAALRTNHKLRLIKNKEKAAIETALLEFMQGKFNNQFTLDIFQAGAGTPYNMNINEIIANRANELIGGKLGKYEFIHPNNHVNMAQSTNDLIPTVTRVAILAKTKDLEKEIEKLEKEFEKHQKKHSKTLKVGRTHLQDAVPITVGQELDSYKQALKNSRKQIQNQSKELKILGIGGTAVGTGITAHPNYKKEMIDILSKLTKIQFKKAKNATEIANNMTPFLNYSSALRSLATNLLNISSDLRIMNSGPNAGLGEITLPAVQPGSSIMPGKVNPSILEMVDMVCAQVLGNDKTIEISAQKSHFELNVMCPIIMYNILQSIEILTNAISTLRKKCISGLKINTKRINDLFENSLTIATALVPHLGYELTAEIVKSAQLKNIGIKKELLERKLFNKKQLKKIFEVQAITNPKKL